MQDDSKTHRPLKVGFNMLNDDDYTHPSEYDYSKMRVSIVAVKYKQALRKLSKKGK